MSQWYSGLVLETLHWPKKDCHFFFFYRQRVIVKERTATVFLKSLFIETRQDLITDRRVWLNVGWMLSDCWNPDMQDSETRNKTTELDTEQTGKLLDKPFKVINYISTLYLSYVSPLCLLWNFSCTSIIILRDSVTSATAGKMGWKKGLLKTMDNST